MSQERVPASTEDQPRSPFFRSMQREMNQFFDRFRGLESPSPREFFEAFNAPQFPAIDVTETEKALEVTAEVPGVAEEDLDVSITRDVLTLKGEKASDHEEKDENDHLVERRYGSFRRSVPLGFVPADDAVEASFKNGVLKLTIAKPEEAQTPARKIKISH